MINKDFDSYPEMRLTLFEFEQTCVEHCFESVLHLSEAHLNKIVASLSKFLILLKSGVRVLLSQHVCGLSECVSMREDCVDSSFVSFSDGEAHIRWLQFLLFKMKSLMLRPSDCQVF